MKNIIFLLIDCLDFNKIGRSEGRNSPTPFLDSLKKQSFWCEKMYSQAPYTEAALIATTCGYDTLDYGGYLKRYKDCPETIFEMVNRAGYEVYAQMWPHFYPSSAFRGIDHIVLRPFSFDALWVYRLEHYYELNKCAKLEKQDIDDLVDILNDNLSFWKDYYKMLSVEDPKVKVITQNMTICNLNDNLERLNVEIKTFNNSPEKYVLNLLQQGREHILFQLFSSELLDRKVPKHFSDKIHKKYNDLNLKIYKNNNQRNRRNNHLSLKRLAKYYKKSENALNLLKRTNFSQYLRNYYKINNYKSLLDRIGPNYPLEKDFISLNSMISLFFEWENQRAQDKPYFAYIHAEDIHGESAIFDYCSNDENEINKQLEIANEYVDNLPKKYKGNLGYDLGLLNVDREIEKFVKKLEEAGKLDDTILIITSDHGCGTTYNPLRGLIQNFHDECYHVPFIVYGKDIEPKIDKELHITKDIMPTIADLVRTKVPKSCTGISVFSDDYRYFINQEYMGPGCPDLYRKPIWMCAFDRKWKIFIKVSIMSDSFDYHLEELYDLSLDPQELNDLSNCKNAQKDSLYLIEELYKRWKVIKESYSREGIYEK